MSALMNSCLTVSHHHVIQHGLKQLTKQGICGCLKSSKQQSWKAQDTIAILTLYYGSHRDKLTFFPVNIISAPVS